MGSNPTASSKGDTMDLEEISFKVPERLFKRIENVAHTLGYNDADEFMAFFLETQLSLFEVPKRK